MKKLFLQSGKLMIGEFPEEPKAFIPETEEELRIAEHEAIHELPNPSPWKAYYAAVESAKAGAVEVVNLESFSITNSSLLDDIKANEGLLHDIPSGWTVEIKEACASDCCSDNGCCEHCREPVKIARLVPSENAQGEKPGSGWSKGNLNVQYVGGIVATGISEAESPESLTFLNEDDWTVPEGGEKTEHDIDKLWMKHRKMNWLHEYAENGLINKQTLIELLKELKPVSSPSQAERGHTMNDIFDWLDSVGHYNSLVTSKDFKGIRLADIIYDFVTRKKP